MYALRRQMKTMRSHSYCRLLDGPRHRALRFVGHGRTAKIRRMAVAASSRKIGAAVTTHTRDPVAHVSFDGCAFAERNERTATATRTLDHLISATKRSWADEAQRHSRS